MAKEAEPEFAPPEQGTPIGVIETDTFCSNCGFNLHTQKVWRDERLRLPICRCPECGTVDAAGRNTSTTNVWLRRLALLGLLFWLGIVLAFIFGTGLLFFGAQMTAPEGLLIERIETRATGEIVVPATAFNANQPLWITTKPDDANPTYAADEVVIRPRFVSWVTGAEPLEPDFRNSFSRETTRFEFVIATALFAIPHVFSAIFLSCLIWFWKRRWQWLWLLLPSLVGVCSISVWKANLANTSWTQVERVGIERYAGIIACVGFVQTLLIAAGLFFGRPIGRFLVSVIIPPKSRQLFAFLWHCDGKTMPAARLANEPGPST